MAAIEVIDTACVYRNAIPHVRSRHAYFPTLCRLPDGELVCGMDIGEAFESLDMRSYVCRSTDEGKTWSPPQQIFEPDTTRHAVSTTCRIGHLGGTELLGWACLYTRPDPRQGLSNPDTGGFCRTDFATVRSTDGGRTWSQPKPVTLPIDWHHLETCAPPLRAGEGRLMMFTSPWPTWEGDPSPWGHDGLALISEDDGRTWTNTVTTFPGGGRLTGFEQAMTTLGDGRIIAVAWTVDMTTQKSVHNRVAFSRDGGRSFEQPIEIPVHGETCRLLALDDNRVLAVYRRVDKPGLWAQLARIEGSAWMPLTDRLLWSGHGVGRDNPPGNAVAAMSTLRFGCPAVLALQDGDLYVVFWAVEQCVSGIHAIRLRVAL